MFISIYLLFIHFIYLFCIYFFPIGVSSDASYSTIPLRLSGSIKRKISPPSWQVTSFPCYLSPPLSLLPNSLNLFLLSSLPHSIPPANSYSCLPLPSSEILQISYSNLIIPFPLSSFPCLFHSVPSYSFLTWLFFFLLFLILILVFLFPLFLFFSF